MIGNQSPHKIPGISPENHQLNCYTFIFAIAKELFDGDVTLTHLQSYVVYIVQLSRSMSLSAIVRIGS